MPPVLVARFAEETDVFGLHLFNVRRSRFEVVFWCSFVLIFSCCTTKTLVRVVQKYADEETVSYVYQKTAANISFPFAEVCFFFGDPVVTGLPTEMVIPSVVDRFTKMKSIDMNASVFVSIIDFLTRLERSEKKLSLSAQRGEVASTTFAEVIDGYLAAEIRAFSNYSSTTTLFDLSNALLLELCRDMQVTISFYDVETNSSRIAKRICDEGDASVVHGYPSLSFCVDVRGADYVFNATMDTLSVRLNTTTVLEKYGISPTIVELWLSSLIARDLISADFEMVSISVGKRQLHNLRINAEYQLLDLRRRPCVEESAKRVWCKSRCEAAFFYATYGCWPLIYRFQFSPRRQNITNNVRLCGVDDYLTSTRSPLRDVLQRGRRCLGECFAPCTQRVYTVESTEYSSAKDAVGPRITASTIFVQSFVYSVIEERLADDFESFLSNFGGALGLFLGMSFASLVHTTLFVGQAIVRYLLGQQSETTKERVEIQAVKRVPTCDERFQLVTDKLQSIECAFSTMQKMQQDQEKLLRELLERTAAF